LDIMPEITSFISCDDLTFRGSVIGTDVLDYDFENMGETDKEKILSYLSSLASVVFSGEPLLASSLEKKA